jgi:CarD family transcriptional regulator
MAKSDKEDNTLDLGARVFYPAHGVADVVGVEERNFGSSPQLFFTLELVDGNKVLLPVHNVERAGVRDLVSVSTARELLEEVARAPELDDTPRRQRVAEYKEGLRTGAADRYTAILQDLLHRSRAGKLAADEKRVLEEARGYFVTEIGAVLELSTDEIAEHWGEAAVS